MHEIKKKDYEEINILTFSWFQKAKSLKKPITELI